MLSGLSLSAFSGKRRFADLSEKEILALAISAEEEDSQIYAAYAAKLRAQYPGSAAVFDGMAAEEDQHRRWLIDALPAPLSATSSCRCAGSTSRTSSPAARFGWSRTSGSSASGKRSTTWSGRRSSSTRLRPRGRPTPKRASSWATSRAPRPSHEAAARELTRAASGRGGARRGEPALAPAVHSHLGAARPCGADGWIGLDACAHLRHRLRHA